MENKNTSSTTNEGLKEIDKQTNPVMYGWRCPVCGRVYSPYVSMCAYCGNNNMNRRLYTILHQICYKTYRCYLISYSSFLTLFHPIESHSPLFRTRRLGKRGL